MLVSLSISAFVCPFVRSFTLAHFGACCPSACMYVRLFVRLLCACLFVCLPSSVCFVCLSTIVAPTTENVLYGENDEAEMAHYQRPKVTPWLEDPSPLLLLLHSLEHVRRPVPRVPSQRFRAGGEKDHLLAFLLALQPHKVVDLQSDVTPYLHPAPAHLDEVGRACGTVALREFERPVQAWADEEVDFVLCRI